jgi:hypothetical protein
MLPRYTEMAEAEPERPVNMRPGEKVEPVWGVRINARGRRIIGGEHRQQVEEPKLLVADAGKPDLKMVHAHLNERLRMKIEERDPSGE